MLNKMGVIGLLNATSGETQTPTTNPPTDRDGDAFCTLSHWWMQNQKSNEMAAKAAAAIRRTGNHTPRLAAFLTDRDNDGYFIPCSEE